MTEEKDTAKKMALASKSKKGQGSASEDTAQHAPLQSSVPHAKESAEKESSDSEEAIEKVKKKKKKLKKKHVKRGKVHIKATYNNTIVTFTDMSGNVLAQSSAGHVGFKGPKKSTPYAASIIVKDASEKLMDMGLKDVDVFVKGIGSGREGAIRALNARGFNMLSIKDVTPMPHNGCRPKKQRRV